MKLIILRNITHDIYIYIYINLQLKKEKYNVKSIICNRPKKINRIGFKEFH